MYKYTYVYIYVKLSHFAVHLKLTQHCKSMKERKETAIKVKWQATNFDKIFWRHIFENILVYTI